jgi:hypothetical protein
MPSQGAPGSNTFVIGIKVFVDPLFDQSPLILEPIAGIGSFLIFCTTNRPTALSSRSRQPRSFDELFRRTIFAARQATIAACLCP